MSFILHDQLVTHFHDSLVRAAPQGGGGQAYSVARQIQNRLYHVQIKYDHSIYDQKRARAYNKDLSN